MQSRMVIFLSALATLSSSTVFAQANDADAATTQREAEFEAARIQREAEEAAASRAIESQVEAARSQMDAARIQLEQAAQQVVIRTQLVDVENGQGQLVFTDENGNRRFGGAPRVTSWTPFGGAVARAQIGAVLVDADGGALVTGVDADSGAADAGLKVGDLIQSIDGIDLADGNGSPSAEISTRLAAIEPGATVQLDVERGGDEIDVGVETQSGSNFNTIISLQSDPQVFLRAERAAANAERAAVNAERAVVIAGENASRAVTPFRTFSLTGAPWGDMELVPITPELGRYFETTEGLLVVRAPSDDAVGLQDGDVILAIGDRTPTSAEHAIRILGSFEPGEVIEFSLMRDARRQTLQYTVEESGFRYFSPNIVVAPAAPAAAAPGARGASPATPGARGSTPPAQGTPAPAPVSPTSP